MADKPIKLVGGVHTEFNPISTSAGAGDAGKVMVTNGSGVIDSTFLPTDAVAASKSITASENLAAGDFVNLHASSGLKARKADGTTNGKAADGFVLAAVTSGQPGIVYFGGINSSVTGATPGNRAWLSGTVAGGFVETPVTSGAGKTSQALGQILSATEIDFQPGAPTTLAA